jgi:Fe-S cluster biogenesis protein NfuA
MKPEEIRILAEPQSETSCRFTVDRPVYPDASYHFTSRESAASSPLAAKLLALDGVASLLISHDQITVDQTGQLEWRDLGKRIGAAIRDQIISGEPGIAADVKNNLPSSEQIRERVQEVLDAQVNPQLGAHGGFVRLVDVRDNNVLLQMGGGCQGCGMAKMTLRNGVEVAIRRHVPEVGAIVDTTDHASGRNPFYAPTE